VDGDGSGVKRKRKKQSFAAVVAFVFISSVGLGFGAGVAQSPDYSNPRKAREAILSWILERVHVSDTKWELNGALHSQGVAVLSLVGSRVRFQCGGILYPSGLPGRQQETRDTPPLSCGPPPKTTLELLESDSRSVDELPALMRDQWLSIDVPRKRLSFQETLEILVGESAGVATSSLAARQYWLARKTRSWTRKTRDVAVLVTSVVTGFSLGYYWGYRNDPNCGEAVLRAQLESATLWTELQARLRNLYRFRFTVDQSGVMQKVESPGWAELNLRDVYLPLRAGRLVDCDSGGLRVADGLIQELKVNSEQLFKHANAPLWMKAWYLLRTMWGHISVFDEDRGDKRYYGLDWWKQRTDHTWEPVPAEVSFLYE
jgi:hypothetical protein